VDNVTHSVAGLLIAEVAVQLRQARAGRAPSPGFRLAAAAAGVVGANLPDADLLYTSLAAGRFAYLLHHRGYTHTVPVALLGALLAWGAVLALWRGGRTAPPDERRADRRWMLGLLVAALLSHLALDATNSYGVHPFWPVDNRWYYGDGVFIVEPWLWVAAVPALLLATARRATRAVLGLVLAIGLALAWTVDAVPWGAALALTIGAGLSFALAAGLRRPTARAAAAVAGWVVVTALFAAASGAARRAAAAAARPDGSAPVDVVITPGAANPLCASAIVVDTGDGRYRVSTARVATVPRLLSSDRCPPAGASAPILRRATRPPTAAVRWDGEWDAPLAELVALARGNCEAAAMLRFVRVPVWAPAPDGAVDLADLRYAGRARAGFAEFRIARRPDRCPAEVPPWRFPREDLLGRDRR
jgi:inner membrane protein